MRRPGVTCCPAFRKTLRPVRAVAANNGKCWIKTRKYRSKLQASIGAVTVKNVRRASSGWRIPVAMARRLTSP
jgi:hypothetical protein